MNLEVYLQNSNTGTIYNITDITQEIQFNDSMDGEAGKLTTILEQDPHGLLQISNRKYYFFYS